MGQHHVFISINFLTKGRCRNGLINMTLGDLISEGAFTVVSGLNEKCLLKCYKSSLLADVRNTMKFTMLSDLFNVSIAENSLHVYLND